MTTLDAPWLRTDRSRAVCAMLTDAGHQAWFVGGCVRNALIGAPVSDLDLTTDARPDRVMELAQAAGFKVVPTGIAHGTVTVIADGEPFEITTFRRDVDTDGRHATVAFADDLADDAARRDFTMNALYAAPDGTIADPLGGVPDAQAGRVRFVGDPQSRIREDYLRILRFFRFFAWYGDPALGIDADGLAACAMNADGLDGLSSERVTQEMLKLLSAPDPAPAVASMAASGVLVRVLTGAAQDVLTVLVHVEQDAGLKPDPLRRLAALGGSRDRLRLSKAQATRIDALTFPAASAGEMGYRLGATIAIDKLAILAASLGQLLDPVDVERARIGAAQTLPVTAADFMPELQGPALGKALQQAESRWILSGFTLSRAELVRTGG
ncbi:CCA tRNA nucleotidyltransferase [Loktanella sp. SALINAS62]|uniref:CCA tRNA nucleotidyltransferase n=1 Tax=Loktanella sp. SALINAS62 TaxID=2706124 RepID=UPI001B8D521D|nr:CCA tRNA nucleotidyltransferase [Loktanella sp. SALINAS62]MBS1302469.1 CCA tRNA nucleotidyltransferase [Loktanella sp. SALINAS62]